ncbi:MAG: FCD domain-containing protein [Candidatus Dormibacteraceae bacterium]
MDPDRSRGGLVRERRLALGLTLEQLARQAQISAAQLSLVERGRRRASSGLAARLGAALELPDLGSSLPARTPIPAADLDLAGLLQQVAFRRRSAFSADSRSEALYRRLHHAIVNGELRPNHRLVEGDLAHVLDVSRTPVRECLQRLAAEGLVEHGGRNWVVHEHSAAEIADIYEVRAALEGYAAYRASKRATPEQRSAILGLANADEGAVDKASSRRVLRNETFHDAIVAAAANPRLADAILESRQYYFNHQLVTLYTPEDTASARSDHWAIASAIAAGDGRRAEQLSRSHVAAALQVVLRSAPEDRHRRSPARSRLTAGSSSRAALG